MGEAATTRAIRWAPYLTAHAHRLYSLSSSQEISGAKLILSRRSKLPEIFTAREIRRKNWVGLTTVQAVTDALECLVDHRFLSELSATARHTAGRTTMRYRWHAYTADFA